MGKKGRLLAGAMLFASCTDNQSAVGSATVGGTLFGTAFSAMDAISGQNHDNGAVGISIVDFPGACALGANEKANAKVLNILPQVAAMAGGTYHVSTNLAVEYTATDANCRPAAQTSATAGTVTLSKLDASGIEGTFDLTFSNDRLSRASNRANPSLRPAKDHLIARRALADRATFVGSISVVVDSSLVIDRGLDKIRFLDRAHEAVYYDGAVRRRDADPCEAAQAPRRQISCEAQALWR